jgi:Ca-activated chloride channel family protein
MTGVARAVSAAVLAAAAAQQLPSFRAGIDVVSLSVTVTDGAGRYVTGLAPEQFGVYEDGVRQDVSYFDRTNVPITLALLLDTSSSMEGKMETAREAAVGFARRLRPRDFGQLIGFATRVEVLQPLTGDSAALERVVRKTTAGGGTALYDALYIALKELKKARAAAEEDIRRQAIVVFTDGEDTSSLMAFDDLLDLARRSETAIYTIALRSPFEIAAKTYANTDYSLRQLSQQTGGRSFFPAAIADLAGVYGQIADELASQYVVGFVSKNTKRDGAWRQLSVRVDSPGATARTRAGYFGPKGKSETCARW